MHALLYLYIIIFIITKSMRTLWFFNQLYNFMFYCAGKLMEKSHIFWIIIKVIDHKSLRFTGMINHLGCWKNTSRTRKSLSAPSCDHFCRHGEWKKYLATKILAKVANWRPTDLKRHLFEKSSKIPDEFNQWHKWWHHLSFSFPLSSFRKSKA